MNSSIKWYLWIKQLQLNYNSKLHWLIEGHLDDCTIKIYNAETQTQEGKRLKDDWKKDGHQHLICIYLYISLLNL